MSTVHDYIAELAVGCIAYIVHRSTDESVTIDKAADIAREVYTRWAKKGIPFTATNYVLVVNESVSIAQKLDYEETDK